MALDAIGGSLPSLPSLPTPATAGAPEPAAPGFGDRITGALEDLDALHQGADRLAEQAAVGSLQDVHDYSIAATQAAVATELTVAVRNKAVEAFQEIMRMPL